MLTLCRVLAALTIAAIGAVSPHKLYASTTLCVDYAQEPVLLSVSDANVQDIEVSGSTLFVSSVSTTTALTIVDATDTSDPAILSTLNLGGPAAGMALSGTWLYLSVPSGVAIVDVSNLASPMLVATLPIASGAVDVALDGSTLYVLHPFALTLVDVTIPSSPVVLSTTPLWAGTTAVRSVHAFPAMASFILVQYRDQLLVDDTIRDLLVAVDVRNPLAPQFTGTATLQYAGQCGSLTTPYYDVQGTLVVVSEDQDNSACDGSYFATLQIFDFSNPLSPQSLDLVLLPLNSTGGPVLAWDPGLFFWEFESGTDGISGIDVSNPGSAAVGAPSRFPLDLVAPLRFGNLVVAGSGHAVIAFDPFDPVINEPLATTPFTGTSPRAVEIVGDQVYLVGTAALDVFDVTDPTTPTLTATTAALNSVSIDVQGGHAYVGRDSFLSIFDVSNPSLPTALADLPMTSTVRDVKVDGTWAHGIDGSDFVLVDVANPAAPFEDGRLSLSGSVRSLDVWGAFVYLANAGDLVRVDPFANPGPKVKTTTSLTGGNVHGIAIRNGLAYVATTGGLSVVELEPTGRSAAPDPAPVEIASIALRTWTLNDEVTLAGDFAYVGSGRALFVVDVSDPTLPMLIGEFLIETLGVAAGADFIAAAAPTGLQLLQLQCGPAAVTVPHAGYRPRILLTAAPNPFHGSTEFTFFIPSRGPVKLDVYDVMGRHVGSLASGTVEAGTHHVSWQGIDGRPAPSGVFFARLQTERGSTSTRIVHLRDR